MTDFYKYNQDIILAFKQLNHNVVWKSDKPSFNKIESLWMKIDKTYGKRKFRKYFESLLSFIKESNFDKIVIIFAAAYFTKKEIHMIKQISPSSEIVYYAWDSLANFKVIKELACSADRAYSFDNNDSLKMNISFLPLFFVDRVGYENEAFEKEYNISNVSTFFIEKFEGYEKAFEIIGDLSKCFYYLKIKNCFYGFKLRLLHRDIYKQIKKYLYKESLTHDEIDRIILKSKAVLDCPLPKQQGLTMRTFEALSKNVKLITTNSSIANYDFYCKDNIYIIGRDSRDLDEFLSIPFNVSYSLSERYSIRSFASELVGGKKVL